MDTPIATQELTVIGFSATPGYMFVSMKLHMTYEMYQYLEGKAREEGGYDLPEAIRGLILQDMLSQGEGEQK